MPKIHHRKARKDYPDNGIKKGDMYYFCQIKTGPYSSRTIRQISPITRSQTTSSEFLSAIYGIEDVSIPGITCADDCRSVAEELRGIAESEREKFENMPEGLQQGDTGQMLEGRADGCEYAADEFETIADEWENVDPEDEDFDQEESDAEFIERATNVEVGY